MTLGKSLSQASKQLAAIPALQANARREAEGLFAHVLNLSRTQIMLQSSQVLTEAQQIQVHDLIARRVAGEPVAYLTGHKGFWSLELDVTPATLIPRPDTELLVELALSQVPVDTPYRIADLGTGSGAIALAIASERPLARVVATDASCEALAVAQGNAKRLKIKNVDFSQGDWCAALPHKTFDLIISNPPYIAEGDSHLKKDGLDYEPVGALVGGVTGLEAIERIVSQAKDYLVPGGGLMIEHGFDQSEAVQEIFTEAAYQEVSRHQDLGLHWRVVQAKKSPVSGA